MPARLTRRQALAGRYRLARVMGACDVGVPATTVAPGPTRFGSFTSGHRGRTVGYGVAWPPGSGPGDRLPVCLLLHAAGDHRPLRPAAHAPPPRPGGRGRRTAAAGAGRGRRAGSSWRPSAGDDPFAMLLEELAAAVLAGLGLRTGAGSLGVLGWSMGGGGALRLAEAAPDRLAAVVATSPAVAPDGEEVAAAGRLHGLAVRVDCGRDDPFAGAARALAVALPAGAEVNLADSCYDGVFWQRQAPPSSASSPPRSPADRRSSVWGETAVSGSIRPSRRGGWMSAATSYRAVAEHLPDAAVVLFDQDLRLQLATGTTLPDRAWCADHHIGRTVVELVPPDQAERLTACYRAALAGTRQHLETPGWRGPAQYRAPS